MKVTPCISIGNTYFGVANSFPKFLKITLMPLVSRCSICSDSVTFRAEPNSISMPKTVSTIKTVRQIDTLKIMPPSVGAIIGAMPLTNINNARNLVSALPLYKSLAIAREMTALAPPVSP